MDRLEWPLVLVLLALVPVLAAAWRLRPPAGTLLYSAEGRAHRAGRTLRSRLRWVPGAFRLGAISLLVLALARPVALSGQTLVSREGVAIQLVVDRSGSMRAPMDFDGKTLTRLDVVKRVARLFVEGDGGTLRGRPDDLIGLVEFAGYADTVCPLIRPHGPLLDLLDGIELPTLRQEDGTAIGDAIALAAARLARAEEDVQRARAQSDGPEGTFAIRSKAIVLLTDGENNRGRYEPLEAADMAARWGVRVYPIGVGVGSTVRTVGGFEVHTGADVNVRELEEIARRTGGRYWAAEDGETLRRIYEEIDRLETTEITMHERERREERFGPLVLAALAALLAEILARLVVFRRAP